MSYIKFVVRTVTPLMSGRPRQLKTRINEYAKNINYDKSKYFVIINHVKKKPYI